MTTISVPIPAHMEESLNNLVKSGYGSNKADVIRRALAKTIEDEAFSVILMSQQDVAEGNIYKGDLKELLNKI